MTREKQIQVGRPACVGMETAAAMFGWPDYYLPFLIRAGTSKARGQARAERPQMVCDR